MARTASFEKLLEEYNTKHQGKRGSIPLEYMHKIMEIGTGVSNYPEAVAKGEVVKIDKAKLIATAIKIGFSMGYRSGQRDARKAKK